MTIVRDNYGVPHVFADTAEELFYGYGYASAQDRLWQGELLRRLGTGTLAELIGPDGIGSDIQMRSLFGPAERRAALINTAPSRIVIALEAYVAGINAWIDEATATGQLPVEFASFGFTPRHWTVDDSVAVFMAVGSQFGWSGSDELTTAGIYAGLVAALGPDAAAEVFADTHWLDDPSAPTTSPDPAPSPVDAVETAPAIPTPDAIAAAAEVNADRLTADTGKERAGLGGDGHASNAIVLAPELTVARTPLLLGGPQMGYSAPQINHEIGLHGGGFEISGMTIIGFPLIPIGVGDGLAWTLTSGGTDNTDIFAEAVDPADPTRYLFNGESLPFVCRVEEIPVAGADPVSHTVCTTVHGPVLAVAGSTAYTLKSVTTGKELISLDAWMRLGGVSDLAGFEEQLDDIAYNFNVLYADDDGNIAYWHIGHIPIRAPGVDPRFPTPGTGEAEWQGTIPFASMPHSLNPDQGYLTSWNNKPAPGWANSSADFWRWGPTHRVNTLGNALGAVQPGTATMATLNRLNRTGSFTTDTPTGTASMVAVSTDLDTMLAAVDTVADARLTRITRILGSWAGLQVDANADGFYDGPAGAIWNAWWQAMSDRVFADDTAGLIDRFVIANLNHRLLARTGAALPLIHDYLDGETVEEAVTGALVTAVDQLTATYGSPHPTDWRQPISVIEWEPLGAGTVPDTIWMNRGTYNQLVELGVGDALRARNVIAPGQSGDLFSPHFSDQLDLYATLSYKPMLLTERQVMNRAESIVTLIVP